MNTEHKPKNLWEIHGYELRTKIGGGPNAALAPLEGLGKHREVLVFPTLHEAHLYLIKLQFEMEKNNEISQKPGVPFTSSSQAQGFRTGPFELLPTD